jgi:hypothetical protein
MHQGAFWTEIKYATHRTPSLVALMILKLFCHKILLFELRHCVGSQERAKHPVVCSQVHVAEPVDRVSAQAYAGLRRTVMR